MKTDKVRVKIFNYVEGSYCRLNVEGWPLAKLHEIHTIFEDRDNWIDIELPQEIDGCKRFEVCIWHNYDNGWQAKMFALVNTERTKLFYELEVTVY